MREKYLRGFSSLVLAVMALSFAGVVWAATATDYWLSGPTTLNNTPKSIYINLPGVKSYITLITTHNTDNVTSCYLRLFRSRDNSTYSDNGTRIYYSLGTPIGPGLVMVWDNGGKGMILSDNYSSIGAADNSTKCVISIDGYKLQ